MQKLQTEDRRRQKWVYPNITSSLISQVDHATKSVKSYGAPKYVSRRMFIETAIVSLLEKEGVKA
jgi:hypothetical protein